MNVLLLRLWIQATADRKRFGLLCALLAVGFLLWARIIIVENIPRQAVAGGNESPGSGTSAQTGDPAPRPLGPRRRVVLATVPLRDPLEINPLYFPKPAEVVDNPNVDGPPDGTGNQERALIRNQLQILVSRFRLEAVMLGNPMAVISGTRYKVGSEVPAVGNEEIRFKLIEVSHRS
ncbi:MAG: hypothetical protein ACYS0D_08140, partial [Planctomycetota bacterium]